MDHPSSQQPTGSSTKSQRSSGETSPTCSPKFAADRARLMFGCYRRSDAADPDTYCAAVAMVLTRYPAAVVEVVTHPFEGLPGRVKDNGYSGMPDVGEVKQACEAEAAKQARWQALQRVRPVQRLALPKPPPDPRAKANHFIPRGFVGYDEAVAQHEAAGAASIAWYQTRVCVDGEERHGIWKPYQNDGGRAWPKKEFKPYTAEELIARYKPEQQAAE